MAKKVDFSSIVESKGESTWYKQAIDDTARYRQAKEIEVVTRSEIDRLNIKHKLEEGDVDEDVSNL